MSGISPAPLVTLLTSLIRSGDLGAIASNTYVAPAEPGAAAEAATGARAEAPAPGLLAGPADTDAVAGFEAWADAAPSAEAGRSLAGLRPPLRPGAGPTPPPGAAMTEAADAAEPTRSVPGSPERGGAAPTDVANPARAANAAAGADPLRTAAAQGATPTEPAPGTDMTGDRGLPDGPPGPILGAGPPAAEARIAAEARTSLRPHEEAHGLPAQPGRPEPEPRRGTGAPERAGAEGERVAARVENGPAPAAGIERERPLLGALGLAALDGWSPATGTAPEQQVERAGIIASFILNAAMIPGWPPPRPFAAPAPGAVLAALVQMPGSPEAGIEEQMRRDGARRTLLARMRALLARLSRSRRLRVMLGLTILLGAIAAIEAELADLARGADADEDVETGRRRLSV